MRQQAAERKHMEQFGLPFRKQIQITENLKEIRMHGKKDFPIAIYQLDILNQYVKLIGLHWHQEIEIIKVQKGNAKITINSESHILTEGSGIIINQNVIHSVCPADKNPCECSFTIFNPSFFFGYQANMLSAKYLIPFTSNEKLVCIFLDRSEQFHQIILDAADHILEYHTHKNFGYELYIKRELISIWLILMEENEIITKNNRTFTNSHLTLDETRAKNVIQFIEKHYTETISLDDIASSIHVSKGECCRCMKRCVKTTPFEYLMKYRIYKAATLIIENENNTPISTLASSVGFNNSSYFNKLFKKYLQCTPSEYKNSAFRTELNLLYLKHPFQEEQQDYSLLIP